MKRIFNYAIITFVALAFISASAYGQEWTKDQKAVWQVVQDDWASWQSGDTEGAFNTIHEKYLGWNNDDPLPINKEKWIKMYEMYKEISKMEFYDLEPARILVEGDNAVVYYYFEFYSTYTSEDEKKEKNIEGRNVEFYIKDGGKWMLLGDMTVFEEEDDD